MTEPVFYISTIIYLLIFEIIESVIVAETVQGFITAMDALKLQQRAVDEIQPLLSELMNSLTKVPGLTPVTFESSKKISNWLIKLNQWRASEELGDEDVRQLIYDLESAYNEFHRYLKVDHTNKKK